jgi:activating signal cointegrator complex subunit 3
LFFFFRKTCRDYVVKIEDKQFKEAEQLATSLHEWQSSNSTTQVKETRSTATEYGSNILMQYAPNPMLFRGRSTRSEVTSQVEDVVVMIPEGEISYDLSTAKPENWVTNFAQLERVDAGWLLRQCKRHAIVTHSDITPEEYCHQIYTMIEHKDSIQDFQESLFALLGFSNMDFVELLLKNRSDLYALIVEEKKHSAGISDVNLIGGNFTITTENEKKLMRMKNRDRKRGKKDDKKSGGGSQPFVISNRNIILKDPLCMVQNSLEDLRTATGVKIYADTSESIRSGLPAGTITKNRRYYTEYCVPYQLPEAINKPTLVPITALDEWALCAFKGYEYFNRIQSKIFDAAYNNNFNLLVCAPTGAGKTNVALLTILQVIKDHRINGYLDKSFKIVYVAPMKALAAEMVENFSSRLVDLKINVREFTGDMTLTKKELNETQIIVTTPEKWDVTTRKPTDGAFVESVKLLIFDEVHLLHEERGPVIETLVARTIRLVETSQKQIRIVGLSATLPNYIDVAEFLRVDPPVGLFFFDSSYRPVPLTQNFIGVVSDPARESSLMTRVTWEKTLEAVDQEYQVMIFVHSRKDTAKTAKELIELGKADGSIDQFAPDDSITGEFKKAKNKDLAQLLSFGFGVHHAGMLRSDRNLVERLFKMGALKVLISTATLAWGVNLPAHTVIIKGTQIYDAKHGGFVDIGMLDIMQIFGRAGRPQFDTSGEGFIITSEDRAQKYLRLLCNQLPIESQFLSRLPDNLNAEIALGTVTSVEEAITWLSYTYWFVRMLKNPIAYGIPQVTKERDPSLYKYREKCIRDAGVILHKAKMIRFSEESRSFSITQIGRAASSYYIEHETISKFNELLKPKMSKDQILGMICQAHEFHNITIREDEVPELESLMNTACKILPVKGGTENAYGKVNILLQAYLSRVEFKNFALVSDSAYVTKNASRILRGVLDIALHKGFIDLVNELLQFCKMVDQRLWHDQHPLHQFGLKPTIMFKLEEKKATLDRLIDMSARDIGRLVSNDRYGDIIREFIFRVPYLSLEASIQPLTRTVSKIRLEIWADFVWDPKTHGAIEPFWIFIDDGETILEKHYFLLHREKFKESHTLEFDVPVSDPRPSYFLIRAVSDRWLQSESEFYISLVDLVLPEEYAQPTKLLPLEPLPRSAVQNEEFEKILRFTHFNPIQTQVFHTLVHTDHNVLIGAPTGSGKTVVAELGILRVFNKYPNSKIVYIGPLKALVKERKKDWIEKFEKILGRKVVELTGDVTPDMDALQHADIVLSTPEKWDGVSRNWKQRKYVQQVGLVVIDEIHMLGQDRGPILEVIVSRMRYMSTQINSICRIIGLSTSLANAKDIADWLGIQRTGFYNFEPSIRPIPLEPHIAGFPGKHYCPRMATMNKPTFQAILQHSMNRPVLVFVASRRQTRLTAQELVRLTANHDQLLNFNHMTHSELEALNDQVNDPELLTMLRFGFGIHHAGLTVEDRTLVENLFRDQKIQILVCTSTLAWGVNLPAHLVVIKGTEFYDAKQKAYVDFPITDVLQMMGRAGRPQYDNHGVAVILVQESKKNYYRKFLNDPFPVESSLGNCFHDHLNAEIVSGMISTKQDCMDYISWTYFYRRLLRNPAYYKLSSTDASSLNLFLSSSVEFTLKDLESAHCIAFQQAEDGSELIVPTPFGVIGSYYYLNFESINLFHEEIKEDSEIESLLNTLCATAEYDELPVRHNEDNLNEELGGEVRFPVDEFMYDDPHTKANLLLQAHFGHLPLPIVDYRTDTKSVLDQAVRIIQAMIDVCVELGFLSSTINCIQLLQMIVQGVWWDQSSLWCLPFASEELVDLLESASVENLRAFLSNPKDSIKIVSDAKLLDDKQLLIFRKECSLLPIVELSVDGPTSVAPAAEVSLKVSITRKTPVSIKTDFILFF